MTPSQPWTCYCNTPVLPGDRECSNPRCPAHWCPDCGEYVCEDPCEVCDALCAARGPRFGAKGDDSLVEQAVALHEALRASESKPAN